MTIKPILWKCMECNMEFKSNSDSITTNYCPYKECQDYKDRINLKLMQEERKKINERR